MNADTFVDREWQDLASEATYRESQKKSPWYLPAKEIFGAMMEKSAGYMIFDLEEKETWDELDIAEIDAFLYLAKTSFLLWRQKETKVQYTCEICGQEGHSMCGKANQ